ncbi:MAG TPA: hypothetical protein VGF17_25090 [Phytomonospora sp.]
MNATDTRDDEIAHYIAAVEDALSDLPPHVRGELIGDLVDHLTEVAGEITMAVPLAARLGPPEGYAAELRSTLPSTADTGARMPHQAAPTTVGQVDWRRIAAEYDRRLSGFLLGYASLGEFLHAARPGWWAVRGMILAQAILYWQLIGAYYILDDGLGTVMLVVWNLLFIVPSIRLGRATPVAARWLNTALSGVAWFCLFAVAYAMFG